ncbi:hypothetical protein SAMN04488069_10456 [Hymenobacter psychrophilus]|uniref:Uncharacterized protein n=1 Tax=Hymenobacter psychrophilus TaxID=651662 RepID=A0A1H3FHL5_9BACT|nr:hypothetical protein SAMN04488069_10456 [Hymenobacter psychrophilus]
MQPVARYNVPNSSYGYLSPPSKLYLGPYACQMNPFLKLQLRWLLRWLGWLLLRLAGAFVCLVLAGWCLYSMQITGFPLATIWALAILPALSGIPIFLHAILDWRWLLRLSQLLLGLEILFLGWMYRILLALSGLSDHSSLLAYLLMIVLPGALLLALLRAIWKLHVALRKAPATVATAE